MKFKLEEDWDVTVEPTDAEVTFRREIDMYEKVFFSQPLYLVCPQFTYEIEIPTDNLAELLNNGYIKVKGVYEDAELDIGLKQNEALPKIEEDCNLIVLDIKKSQESNENKVVIHLPKSAIQNPDLLPTDTEDALGEGLYILNGVNAYRLEAPIYTLEKWVQDGLATQIPNSNSKMIFQKLKRQFQEHCKSNNLPYTAWINE